MMSQEKSLIEVMDFFIDVFREVMKIDEFDIVNEIMKYPDVHEVAKDISKEDLIEYIYSCYPTDEDVGLTTWDVIVDDEYYKIEFLNK